jgi:NodT family efflux transporter outer membrane factor (OMF) lipoprotein
LLDGAAPAFKEAGAWKAAQPGQADVAAKWWTVYQDAQLNALVDQALKANQTLVQVQNQYRQALALVPAAQAAFTPTLGLNANVARSEAYSQGVSSTNTTHAWSLQAGWEPDFWGRISRSVELAGANAQASADDFAAARLTVQATLVNNYLQLRLADRQSDMFDRLIQGYTKALQIAQSQQRMGVASKTDVELANATLSAAQAQAQDIRLTRAQLEHALAVLVGTLPAQFSVARLAPDAALPQLPDIPAIVPSELLERRPDIAAAERRVAAANANIGVVRAAWFPRLTLSASYGNAGPSFDNWLYTPFEAWAVGGALAATLFDGGLRSAQNDQAKAAFDGAAAAYRQIVLNGFQEVEDNLSAMAELQREINYQNAAVQSSRVAERAILNQYRAGTAPYTAVVTVQASTLANERTALQLQGRLFAASVTLIKAIGGGWMAVPGTPNAVAAQTESK